MTTKQRIKHRTSDGVVRVQTLPMTLAEEDDIVCDTVCHPSAIRVQYILAITD